MDNAFFFFGKYKWIIYEFSPFLLIFWVRKSNCYMWNSTHVTARFFLFVGPPVKRRKRHRRKHFQNQEPCLMRGVYFKNMKWQAAIKVDKKQIHLGTVGSQEEAARLYDR
jgi:hypothetical protein